MTNVQRCEELPTGSQRGNETLASLDFSSDALVEDRLARCKPWWGDLIIACSAYGICQRCDKFSKRSAFARAKPTARSDTKLARHSLIYIFFIDTSRSIVSPATLVNVGE